MSGDGAEARNETLAEMVGSSHSEYPRDKSGAHRIQYGGGDRYGVIGGRDRLGYGRTYVGIIK